MTHRYILDGHTPVAEPDLTKWANWYETAGKERLVADTEVNGVRVLTFFLGVDYNFSREPHVPILFQTDVAGGPWNRDGERCRTWAEAEAMHARWVERFKSPAPRAVAADDEDDPVDDE